jgi:CheY-like chemotaxis protein
MTPMSGNRSTILFVDDDALIAMSAVDMLEEMGFDALSAHSGKEALATLAAHGRISLMITDYSMPDMSGAELVKIVEETYPLLPILLTTGYTTLPSGELVHVPRITKPYMHQQLKFEIDRLLAAAQSVVSCA